jgi:hypothetical protein
MENLVTNLANNQVVIENRQNGKKEFFSYSTKIAEKGKDGIFLDSKNWNYSKTTIKYLCEFLGYRGKKFIQQGIDNGVFKLKNLN